MMYLWKTFVLDSLSSYIFDGIRQRLEQRLVTVIEGSEEFDSFSSRAFFLQPLAFLQWLFEGKSLYY